MGKLYSFFFFFSSRRRHTRCLSDWSSDVCSSDLQADTAEVLAGVDLPAPRGLRCGDGAGVDDPDVVFLAVQVRCELERVSPAPAPADGRRCTCGGCCWHNRCPPGLVLG